MYLNGSLTYKNLSLKRQINFEFNEQSNDLVWYTNTGTKYLYMCWYLELKGEEEAKY